MYLYTAVVTIDNEKKGILIKSAENPTEALKIAVIEATERGYRFTAIEIISNY